MSRTSRGVVWVPRSFVAQNEAHLVLLSFLLGGSAMPTRFIAARRRAAAFRKLRAACIAFQKAEIAAAQLPALRAAVDQRGAEYLALRPEVR